MPVRFGVFTLDESRRQVLQGQEALHLSPKAFQLLSILIREAPKAVAKNDLQEQLWPDTFVSEGNLPTLVNELRSALSDDAREPRFIRTLYGFGYSFAAPLGPSIEQPSLPPPARPHRVGHLTGVALSAAMAAVLLLSLRSSTAYIPTSSPAPIRSIAILPFDTTGADRGDQKLGLGLPDLLIARLTNIQDVVVRPTSAIRDFAGRQDSEEIGRKLKVDAVLEGTVRTSPDRIRVTVQLLNVRNNKPIWAERFDEKRSDMFTIEDSLSGKLAEALRIQLTPEEKLALGKRQTSNPEAYEDYVQGRYHLEQTGPARYYADEPLRAIEFFQKAVDKDPRFAAAWSGLGVAYFQAGWYHRSPRQTAYVEARNAAQRALDLDPTLSEAHGTLGGVKAALDLDFEGALQVYDRALELNPRDTYALLHYAYLLQSLGRFDQAIALRKRIIEIDPVSTNSQWGLANAYLTSGQNDLGAKQVQVVLGMDPDYAEAHIALIRLAITRGDYNAAIAEARKQAEIPENTRALSFLGYALARAGRRDEALAVLHQISDKKKQPNYFFRAIIYAGLGDADAMMPLLEKGAEDRDTTLRLKTEPIFLPYHSDPRFSALLKRAGFKS